MITSEPHVDLSFKLRCESQLWSDHGFALFGAVSRLLPDTHEANSLGILPISGGQVYAASLGGPCWLRWNHLCNWRLGDSPADFTT